MEYGKDSRSERASRRRFIRTSLLGAAASASVTAFPFFDSDFADRFRQGRSTSLNSRGQVKIRTGTRWVPLWLTLRRCLLSF